MTFCCAFWAQIALGAGWSCPLSLVLKVDYCFPSKVGVEFDKQEEEKKEKEGDKEKRENQEGFIRLLHYFIPTGWQHTEEFLGNLRGRNTSDTL